MTFLEIMLISALSAVLILWWIKSSLDEAEVKDLLATHDHLMEERDLYMEKYNKEVLAHSRTVTRFKEGLHQLEKFAEVD